MKKTDCEIPYVRIVFAVTPWDCDDGVILCVERDNKRLHKIRDAYEADEIRTFLSDVKNKTPRLSDLLLPYQVRYVLEQAKSIPTYPAVYNMSGVWVEDPEGGKKPALVSDVFLNMVKQRDV